MPIYEYECSDGHISELFKRLSDTSAYSTTCTICGKLATKIVSLPGNITIGKPTRVFIDQRTGQAFTPANEYEKAPANCKEIELKNPVERSRFENEQQRMVDVRNELTSRALNESKNEATKRRHDNLKARMNAVQKEIDPKTGEEVKFTLDEKSKDLLKKSMNRSRDKKERVKKSEVMLAVNHMDKGNLTEVN